MVRLDFAWCTTLDDQLVKARIFQPKGSPFSTSMRWGMPPPPRRRWLSGDEHQECLVAALAGLAEPGKPLPGAINSFAEYAPEPNPETKKKDVVWFALSDDRPLAAFAGIWTE
jgi:hypothetical protein